MLSQSLPGPLANLPNNPASNFRSGRYDVDVLPADQVFYRGGKAGGGKNALGQWFTTSPPTSAAGARIDSAVKAQWLNSQGALTGTSPIESVYGVKIPQGTTVYPGPVGYQGGIYLGGEDKIQYFIREPWKIPDIQVMSESKLP